MACSHDDVVCVGVLLGQVEQLDSPLDGIEADLADRLLVLGVGGAADRQLGDHRDQGGPHRGGQRSGAAATRDGIAAPQALQEFVDGEVGELG